MFLTVKLIDVSQNTQGCNSVKLTIVVVNFNEITVLGTAKKTVLLTYNLLAENIAPLLLNHLTSKIL